MQPYVEHFVRRSVAYTQAAITANGEKPEMPQIPAWGQALLFITVVAFGVFFLSIQYTLTDVLGTLTMIETPTNAIALPTSEEEADKKDYLLEPPQMAFVKPVTSKIRATIKHITAIGGRWARWRGIVPAMIYSFLASTSFKVLKTILPRFPGQEVLCRVLAAVILARVHMAWTHAVISMPSSRKWYQRLAPYKSAKKLWLPTAVNTVAIYVVIYLTIGFAMLLNVCYQAVLVKKEGSKTPHLAVALLVLEGLAVLAFGISMVLLILLPAAVTLARIAASMLPGDQEAIVPFDRTFGGKIVPEMLGGTSSIGFVDAWRTFDWEARRRVIKLYLKTFLIMTFVFIATMHLVALETWAIMGPQVGQLAASGAYFFVYQGAA